MIVGTLELTTRNFSGHTFSDYFVSTDRGSAPGYFVFGRNAEKYGRNADGTGAYVMLCARPNVKRRKLPHYNVHVRRGWTTKRDAQRVADALNGKVI